MKSIFKTKTFWVNAATLVLTATSGDVAGLVSAHPSIATALVTGANLVLRYVTKQPVNITGNTKLSEGG